MKPLYITNVPIPEQPLMDAHFQELDLLQQRFGGDIKSAFPLKKPASWMPRSIYGWKNIGQLKQLAAEASFVHVFSPSYHLYAYLKAIKPKRLIYTTQTPMTAESWLPAIDHLIVYDEQSYERLRHVGRPISLSPPHVAFKQVDAGVLQGPFTLLMASAPWEDAQFHSKGIHTLIAWLERTKDTRIIFLWRNLLFDKMKKIVADSGLSHRIELVNEKVNVEEYLTRAHAVVLLANQSSLVKAYPHSLMEGLLAGRPVVTSAAIPMARFIAAKNLGTVVHSFDSDDVDRAMNALQRDYATWRQHVLSLSADTFSSDRFIACHEAIYHL